MSTTTRAIPTATAAFRENNSKNKTKRHEKIIFTRTAQFHNNARRRIGRTWAFGGNERRSHARTDAMTRDGTWNAAITVSDGGAGRTAAARSRTDSARLTGRPVSCRSPSTARLLPVGGIGGGGRSGCAADGIGDLSLPHSLSLSLSCALVAHTNGYTHSAFTLGRSLSLHRRSSATTRTRTCDRTTSPKRRFFQSLSNAAGMRLPSARFVPSDLITLVIGIYYMKYARAVPRVSLK